MMRIRRAPALLVGSLALAVCGTGRAASIERMASRAGVSAQGEVDPFAPNDGARLDTSAGANRAPAEPFTHNLSLPAPGTETFSAMSPAAGGSGAPVAKPIVPDGPIRLDEVVKLALANNR